MSRRLHRAIYAASIFLPLFALTSLGASPAAAGITITVDSTADNLTNDGLCTLREAITAADTNASVNGDDDCYHDGTTTGSDTIVFDASLNGTPITLSNVLPTISSDVTIIGNGQASTIIQASICNPVEETSCTHFHHVLAVGGTGSDVLLTDLTIRHGRRPDGARGGNIFLSGGMLELNRVTVTHGKATYGGGIGTDPSEAFTAVILSESTISENESTLDGGGLYLDTTSSVFEHSTLSGNVSGGKGGAVYISNRSSDFENSTISGNRSADFLKGGIYYFTSGEMLTLTNTTITDNYGGGLQVVGALRIYNTVIANNTTMGSDCSSSGTITGLSGVLIGDNTCGFTGGVDPQLLPLDDYGGSTQTHALDPNSPLIDAGSDTYCLLTDQRDLSRPRDGDQNGAAVCDIGAVEYNPVAGPAQLSADPISQTQIDLTWTDTSSDEDGFAIERSLDGVAWSEIGDNAPNDTTFSDAAAVCNTTYHYRVRARRDNDGAYSYSPSTSASTWTCGTFADVPVLFKEWMQPWIELFYEANITTGCGLASSGQPLYCPENVVTRGAMSVFLLRAMNYPNLPHTPSGVEPDLFADVPTPGREFMEPWIEDFYTLGITGGCGQAPLRFCPENAVTRAAMAVFILRALEGPDYVPPDPDSFFADMPVAGKEWMVPYVDEMYRRGITGGCGVSPLRFCPENPVTRGAMAVFILRAFDSLPNP